MHSLKSTDVRNGIITRGIKEGPELGQGYWESIAQPLFQRERIVRLIHERQVLNPCDTAAGGMQNYPKLTHMGDSKSNRKLYSEQGRISSRLGCPTIEFDPLKTTHPRCDVDDALLAVAV